MSKRCTHPPLTFTTITSIDVSPDSIPGSAPAPVAPAPLTLTPFPDLVVFSTSTPADAPPVRFSAIGFVSDMQIVSMTIVNATTSEGAVGSYTLDISNVQNVEDDNYNSLLLSGVSVGDKVIVQGTLYRGVVSVDRIITFGNPDATVTPPAPVADVPTVTTTPDTSDTSTSTDATSTDATATTTGTTTSTDVTVLVPNASSSDQSGTPDATVPPTN